MSRFILRSIMLDGYNDKGTFVQVFSEWVHL